MSTVPGSSPNDHAISQALAAGGGSQKRDWRPGVRALLVVLMLSVSAAAVWAGYVGRAWVYDHTESLRMRWDIDNAWTRGRWVVTESRKLAGLTADPKPPRWWEGWGSSDPKALEKTRPLTWPELWDGYLSMYDMLAATARSRGDEGPRYRMDYSPFRLAIVSAWAKDRIDRDPANDRFTHDDVWPLMHFNTAMAALSAAAMFATVLMWRVRCDRHALADPRLALFASRKRVLQPQDRVWMVALLAAVICWVNPSSVLNSHAFVQWDTWILPFVILAMGLAAMDCWGWAGLLLGISMGFKGQQLMVLPVFALWPIFQWRWGAFSRFGIGFAFAFLCIGLPWLIPNGTAWLWVGTVVALAMCFAPHGYPKRVGLTWWLAAGVATALVIGPYLNQEYVGQIWAGLLIVAAMILLPWTLPGRSGWPIVGLIAIAAILSASWRFGGSWNWFVISYIWPSYQYKTLYMGTVHNLPAILGQFGWSIESVLYSGKLAGVQVELSLRGLLIGLYGIACVLCALAAAIQQRRRDPALLIALAAPWVLAFTLLPQMHERYLTWAAAVCGVGLACSLGMGLLHWVLIGVSSLMIFSQMLSYNRAQYEHAFSIAGRLQPDLGWVLLLTCGLLIYAGFARTRRS